MTFTRHYKYLQGAQCGPAFKLNSMPMFNPNYEDSSSFPLHCITFLYYITFCHVTLHYIVLPRLTWTIEAFAADRDPW